MECGIEQMMKEESSISFYFVVLGIEFRPWHTLGKPSTTELYPQVDLELTLSGPGRL